MSRPLYHNISDELENAKTNQNADTRAHRLLQANQKNNIPKIIYHVSWRNIVSQHTHGHELRKLINEYQNYLKSSKERYQNSITHNYEDYREHFYVSIKFNRDDIVLLNNDSIAFLNQDLERNKDYDTISVKYSDQRIFTIYKKDIVAIIPKNIITPRLLNMLTGIIGNYTYLGGSNKYVYIKNHFGKRIRKKIYMIDNKEKVRTSSNKYVSINTYKKNYLS